MNDCVKSVSELREADHNYCFFRDGVEPNWDAAVHKDGGRFVVNFRVAGAGVRDSVATVVPKPKRGVKKMIEEIAAADGVEDVSTISLEEPEMDIDHVWQTIVRAHGSWPPQRGVGGVAPPPCLRPGRAWNLTPCVTALHRQCPAFHLLFLCVYRCPVLSLQQSLGVVGGDFDREGLVTGAMIERKRGKKHSSGPEYRVSVWLSQGLTNETAEQIGYDSDAQVSPTPPYHHLDLHPSMVCPAAVTQDVMVSRWAVAHTRCGMCVCVCVRQ